MSIRKIKSLVQQKDEAENKLYDEIKNTFPVGASIEWRRRGATQEGEVLNQSHDRVLVRNNRTGKEYWIYVYWALD